MKKLLAILLLFTATLRAADVATVSYELLPATWSVNNTSSVNPINFDFVPPPTIVPSGSMAGNLLFMASYTRNLAGGMLSTNEALPALPGRSFQYIAYNVWQYIPAYPDQTIMRDEMDVKWTLVSGSSSPLPNQANVSTQINTQTGSWQLDPSGTAWVDSGYIPSTFKTGQWNLFQIRAWSDGKTVWSVTGLRCNQETPFVPGSTFQNIPLVSTNWGTGLHPQLQWEGGNAPFSATVYYSRVQLSVSEAPIPFI